jgi:hypothetical protein
MGRAKPQKKENPYTELNEPYGDTEDMDETQKFNGDYEDEYSDLNDKKNRRKDKKAKKGDSAKSKPKGWDIIVPIITFLVCGLIGYAGMYLVFNAKHLLDKVKPTTETTIKNEEVVMYVLNDETPVYESASLDSNVIATLNSGDTVTYKGSEEAFSQISTSTGIEGYVLSVQLSTDDPTLGDELPEMQDPTPEPTEGTTAAPTEAEYDEPEETEAPYTEEATEAPAETTTEETTTEAVTEYEPDDAPSETTTEATTTAETTTAATEATAAETPAET